LIDAWFGGGLADLVTPEAFSPRPS
jgi:hypothetical protein